MFAVMADGAGSVSWREVPEPHAGPGQVLLEVRAAGMNQADLHQAAGNYPPPAGESEVQGLECSGVIAEVGEGVTGWRAGQEACALVPGGAQAERIAIPAGLLAPVPGTVSLIDAAALPEAAATTYSNLVQVAGLTAGEWVLIHGGAGGIGSFAIQLARALGARVIATAGGPGRAEWCRQLGAEVAIDYKAQDFTARTLEATGSHGADVILDVVGAAYLAPNLAALASDGRLVVIGRQRGSRAELDLGLLLAKRAAVIGTTVRSRPLAQREQIMAGVRECVWPLIGHGIEPVIEARLPMSEPAGAYGRLASGGVAGKLVLVR